MAATGNRGRAGTPPLDVAAGLVFHQGRLLIARRPEGTHLAGCWEFPGGKVEPGETIAQCLERELQEELGIRVSVGPLVERVDHAYPEKTVRLSFFACHWLGGEPRPLGCAAFRWVAAEELAHYQFPGADARLLERLRTEPGLWSSPPPPVNPASLPVP